MVMCSFLDGAMRFLMSVSMVMDVRCSIVTVGMGVEAGLETPSEPPQSNDDK
jgi:hypothetical protein